MKKKYMIFGIFTAAAVVILAVLCYMKKLNVLDFDITYAGVILTIVPATAAAVAKINDEKYRKINRLFLVLFGGLSILLFLDIIGILQIWAVEIIGGPMVFIASIGLFWLYKKETGKPVFEHFWQISRAMTIFVLILWVKNTALILLYSDQYAMILGNLTTILTVPLVIFLCSVQYWGEEYAWRGILQGALQSKFGKRWGIVVLGVIWETYHCPLWFTVYDLQIWEVFMRYIFAIGLSFALGYLYIKTENVWAPVLGHCIYNTVGNTGINIQMGTVGQIIFTLILAGVFGLFAFTKEFGEKS
nr:CPBP family intramembrane glutamic endopeptidase [uncultured Sellimonas sp.]